MIEELEKQDRKNINKLIAHISYFHGVFARTKDPIALEVAKNLGLAVK